ncbi:glycosyltransferase [Vulcanococcus sp.]|uniref:glycosyltransferase n=1 Tax=Vulcanococcus sp. TaxID=2856995 RepID=UPI0037DA3305
MPLAPALGDCRATAAVLQRWRQQGPAAALQHWQGRRPSQPAADPLWHELGLRLQGQTGPRLLVDGLWFCRPHGGITRVWEQILSAWSLPGMLSDQAPVALVERNSHLALSGSFPSLEGPTVDPLDPAAVADLAHDNAALARRWGATVFLSSWISSCGAEEPAFPELALVHDCLPERYGVPEPLRQLRRRWLMGAGAHLAVSAATAADLEVLLSRDEGSVPWCHPAPATLFAATLADPAAAGLWQRLGARAQLRPPFLLLPATSAIGSYKNPELVAEALAAPELHGLQLVLCGIAAEQRRQELEQRFPHLQGRCQAAGFSDLELALAYRHALAVVLPSHAEGFGLPAVEAMASGATVLVADSRGLREAGAGAALRFHPKRAPELAALLRLLMEPGSPWLQHHLAARRQRRLEALHPDLLGLALLALARRLAP